MDYSPAELWDVVGPIYWLVIPPVLLGYVEWSRRRNDLVARVQIDKNYSDLLQGAITRTANDIVLRAGGPKILTFVPLDSVQLGVRLVREAVPDAVAHFEKRGLTDDKIAAKLAPQAQAVIDAVPVTQEILDALEAGKAPPAPDPTDQAILLDILEHITPPLGKK